MAARLAMDLVEAMDRAFPDVETICLHIYGGEPLLNIPALRAMVRAVLKKPVGRFVFSITTNGTILTDEVFELLDAGRFYVILSIDGPARVHDACRRFVSGEPSHARVIEFLDKLRSRTHCRIWGSAVVRSGWSLMDAEGYLESLGMDAFKAQKIRACEGGDLAMTAEEHQQYLDQLMLIGQGIIDDLEAGRRPHDNRFSSLVFQILMGWRRERYCGAGESCFGIAPDGTVLSCLLLDPVKSRVGHINDLLGQWRRAGNRWAGSRPRKEKCLNCDTFSLCGGGCPAVNPLCGDGECDIIRMNVRVARRICKHFENRSEVLLGLAGHFITLESC